MKRWMEKRWREVERRPACASLFPRDSARTLSRPPLKKPHATSRLSPGPPFPNEEWGWDGDGESTFRLSLSSITHDAVLAKLGRQALHDLLRPIGRGVVDDDDLKGEGARWKEKREKVERKNRTCARVGRAQAKTARPPSLALHHFTHCSSNVCTSSHTISPMFSRSL